MLPLISIGIVAGLFFGLLSVSAAGKFYYLFRYKKKRQDCYDGGDRKVIEERSDIVGKNGGGAWLLCWRKASPIHDNVSRESSHREEEKDAADVEMGYGMTVKSIVEEGVEAELMRLHNLCGPPRFLFTIKEETVEDLASEDGKTKTRLIDLMRAADSNFLSPIASPIKKSSLTSGSIYSNGFLNPLYESSAEAEMNRLRASPPPKFKFLRDAEEKLRRKLQAAESQRDLNGENFQMQQARSCSSDVVSAPEHDVRVHVQVIS
ncbi:hypothetical protein QQ045_005195 [Rhodiola kirilowii]